MSEENEQQDTQQTTPQQTTPQQTFFKTLISTILSKITLTGSGITKADSWPDTAMEGDGFLVAEITEMEQPNPGLPDWFFSISVTGKTFASEDPDKEKIRKMFSETLMSISQLRTTDFTTGCVGILQISQAAPRSSDEENTFSIDFKLVFTDITF